MVPLPGKPLIFSVNVGEQCELVSEPEISPTRQMRLPPMPNRAGGFFISGLTQFAKSRRTTLLPKARYLHRKQQGQQ